MSDKLLHFGVWIKKSPKNRISRENYAIIDKTCSIWMPSMPLRYADPEERKRYFEDVECRTYCDAYCEEWREKCLINFDKNMAYFKQITTEEFEDALNALIGSNSKIRQVSNLNDCNQLCGIYIMVLDEYRQVYIGQSKDIKKRIMSHWNRQKAFDRLLCGDINDSVLSIDCFGALDTTRIFVLETTALDHYEVKLQKGILSGYKLNRMAGGVPKDKLDLVTKALDRSSRDLRNFHNDEYAEKYEKELDVIYFVQQCYCRPEDLNVGNIVCIERTNRGKLLPQKYFGKVIKATKSRRLVSRYCSSVLGYSCIKRLKAPQEEIRVKKTMLFSTVVAEENKEFHTFWRSKKFPHIEA